MSEAIEACLESDIKAITGKKLLARCYLLNLLNVKYDKAYFANTVLEGALNKTPEDLKKVKDFRNFLSERRMLIEEFKLIDPPSTLDDIMDKTEMSGLPEGDVQSISKVQDILR